MRILFINLPSRKGLGGLCIPLGPLYAASAVKRSGHHVMILDPHQQDHELIAFDKGDFSVIDQAVRSFVPDLIGFGGIATSYGRAKKLSLYLNRRYPSVLQIAGGPLSSVYRLLLMNTKVSFVFHGETENSLPEFLGCLEAKADPRNTLGISFERQGVIVRNPQAQQISNLDDIPMPDFDLVDIRHYLLRVKDWLSGCALLLKHNSNRESIFSRIGGAEYYLPIVTSRGCTHHCSFCYRHVQGVRQHSVEYVIRLISYLSSKYNIRGFHFSDELFNSRKKWVNDFSSALGASDLNIFYILGGMRVDMVDGELLRELKRSGCIAICYGHESGSDTILKEIGKGVSREQNIRITNLTNREVGILNIVQLVIGSPLETDKTISETLEFLKEVGAYQYSLNYLLPLPETPIWEHVEQRSLIENVEEYLDLVAENGGAAIVNLTSERDDVWKGWNSRIHVEMKLFYYRRYNVIMYVFYSCTYRLLRAFSDLLPVSVKKNIPRFIKQMA